MEFFDSASFDPNVEINNVSNSIPQQEVILPQSNVVQAVEPKKRIAKKRERKSKSYVRRVYSGLNLNKLSQYVWKFIQLMRPPYPQVRRLSMWEVKEIVTKYFPDENKKSLERRIYDVFAVLRSVGVIENSNRAIVLKGKKIKEYEAQTIQSLIKVRQIGDPNLSQLLKPFNVTKQPDYARYVRPPLERFHDFMLAQAFANKDEMNKKEEEKKQKRI